VRAAIGADRSRWHGAASRHGVASRRRRCRETYQVPKVHGNRGNPKHLVALMVKSAGVAARHRAMRRPPTDAAHATLGSWIIR
jgi:hypothetical protein